MEYYNVMQPLSIVMKNDKKKALLDDSKRAVILLKKGY